MNNLKDYFLLVGEALYHRYLYYKLDAPELSDWDYDQLERKIREIESEQGWACSMSPSVTVGNGNVITPDHPDWFE